MNAGRWVRGSLMAAVIALPAVAVAGPVQDFEKQLAAVYTHYRTALFETNQKKQGETLAAIAAFAKGWSEIVARKSSPPPQYAEDPRWGETLDKVSGVLVDARAEAERGELAKSHETLELIRDLIGDLRLRNGIVSFSDRMNAYHEVMEQVFNGSYEAEAGLAKLREDAAVLAYLAGELERSAPAELQKDQPFRQGLAAVKASVNALQAAARAGDVGSATALRKALRPPYSRLFLKYG